MERIIKKSISIHSTPEKVWSVLTSDGAIREWATPFSEGTHALSDRKLWSDISRYVWEECCVKGRLTMYEEGRKLVTTFYEENENNWFSDVLWDTIESYEIIDEEEGVRLNIISWPTPEQLRNEYSEMMSTMWYEALVIIKDLSEK